MEKAKTEKNIRIGALAAMFGLTVRTIRYYEELGLLVSFDRNEGVHRTYDEGNIILLKRILRLKSLGLSLNEIKEFFDLVSEDASGEKCRDLLLHKYGERMEMERKLIADAQKRLEEWAEKAAALKGAEHFFECPGLDCFACDAADRCSLARGGG